MSKVGKTKKKKEQENALECPKTPSGFLSCKPKGKGGAVANAHQARVAVGMMSVNGRISSIAPNN